MSADSAVRPVDFAAVAAHDGERFSQELVGAATGETTCMLSYIVTPEGGGSPAGLHVHEVDQVFYILEGTMQIEIEGETNAAEAGSVIVFPKGVPHRNWNDGPGRTVHLAVNTPTPPQDRPFATSV
jgi:mannose-6-phosphate isomerase-like protein (cupin superfamily)